nr:hypothetical protein [uncultured Desulfobacter sp.]
MKKTFGRIGLLTGAMMCTALAVQVWAAAYPNLPKEININRGFRPMIKINSPILLAFLAFFFVAPLGTYFNMLPSERLE